MKLPLRIAMCWIAAASGLSAVWSTPSLGADAQFERLVPTLNSLRRGQELGLSVRFAKNRFDILQMTKKTITRAEGQAARKPNVLPRIKFDKDGVWIDWEVDQLTIIEQPAIKGGVNWRRYSGIKIASYPRKSWAKFFDFAIRHGLCQAQQIIYRGGAYLTLSFSPLTPSFLQLGSSHLILDEQFRNSMRISTDFPPASGSAGYVLLLHDPHWDVNGRFETLDGLRALTAANPATKFRFLVEGYDPNKGDRIGFSGLDGYFKAGSGATEATVRDLLTRYLINVPMAYRLLYDRTLPADAIDNSQLLANEKLGNVDVRKALKASLALYEALQATRSTANDLAETKRALTTAVLFMQADTTAGSDSEELIDYLNAIASFLSTAARNAQTAMNQGVKIPREAIVNVVDAANAYRLEAADYQRAVARNNTMSPAITAAGKTYQSRMPIAFIGNFHTSGITAYLRAHGIGYAVIEPRPRERVSDAEIRAFSRVNQPGTRYQALPKAYMGYVAPTPSEVVRQYAPRISAVESRLATRAGAFNTLFAKQGSAVDPARLLNAADENGFLTNASFAGGSGGHPPPPTFKGAFAFFEPEAGGGAEPPGGGGRGTFFIPDPSDKRWNSQARYDFISHMMLAIHPREKEVKLGWNIVLYEEPSSKTVFTTVYDPDSGRTYCFQNDIQKIASLVPIPRGLKGGNNNVRMQVTDLFLKRLLAAGNA